VRRFAVVGHRAPTSPDFPLEDLPGSAGRLDILVRCVTAALHVSHGLRRDTEIRLILQGPPRPPRTLRLVGDRLRGLNPDERSTASRLRKALAYDGLSEREVSPGILASGQSLADAVAAWPTVRVLDREGSDLRSAVIPEDAAFLLSDDADLAAAEQALVPGPALSAGPVGLHADQVITLVQNELDRRDRHGA
jgi:tRNA (pseudouridine54-N1)-methyltransferase